MADRPALAQLLRADGAPPIADRGDLISPPADAPMPPVPSPAQLHWRVPARHLGGDGDLLLAALALAGLAIAAVAVIAALLQ